MGSYFLKERGFSLIELSLVLMIAAVFLAVTLYSGQKTKQVALAQRVMEELNSIASASIRYYSANGAWSANIADLRPGYLTSSTGDLNPFGNAYTITAGSSRVSVSTLLPRSLITSRVMGSELVVVNQGSNDLVSLTKSVESNNWKLKYDKKYLYKQ